MKRRELLKFLGAGLAASALPISLARAEKTQQLLQVWGAPVAPSVLLGVAARRGDLHRKIPYQVKVWKTPDQLRAGVVNQSMPLTMVPSYVAANFANRGKDVILMNIMTFGLLQIVSNQGKINQLSDLVGKKLVMPFKNDMPDLVLQILCKAEGIDFKSINIQYAPTPPEAMALFLKRQANFAFLPEPLTTVAIMKGKQSGQLIERALDVQQEWGRIMKTKPRIPQAGMQVEREFYLKNQENIHLLQADLEKAVPWVANNPRSAAEIASSYLPMPTNILELALPYAKLAATPTSEIVEETLQFFEAMYRLNPKILGGKMPDPRLFSLSA